ncbi:hypothetical protein GCM10022384_06940 [Streptomyces marokkonensis]|uniref:Uncharacterized protein n=1 Tax=Streptomyces marokkonensis TaxID=324855 RepID=A0ABP7NYM5_9ACTN
MGFGDPESAQFAVGRAGTIHGVKGQEEDAVLIVVPPLGKDKEDTRSDRLIEAWTTGATAECAPEPQRHYASSTSVSHEPDGSLRSRSATGI